MLPGHRVGEEVDGVLAGAELALGDEVRLAAPALMTTFWFWHWKTRLKDSHNFATVGILSRPTTFKPMYMYRALVQGDQGDQQI